MRQHTRYWLWLRRFSSIFALAGAVLLFVTVMPAAPDIYFSMQSGKYTLSYDGETACIHWIAEKDLLIPWPDGWHVGMNNGERIRRWQLPYITRDVIGDVRVRLPIWTVAAGFFALSTTLLFITRRPRGSTQCSRCGYDLTGNISGMCPECGLSIANGSGEAKEAMAQGTCSGALRPHRSLSPRTARSAAPPAPPAAP